MKNLLIVALVVFSISSLIIRSRCFNVYYPDIVIAEDNSIIECPAVFYRGSGS